MMGNFQSSKAFPQSISSFMSMKNSNSFKFVISWYKNLHIESLRFTSTKRIWKAIFIEETRRNVLAHCKNLEFLRWKSISKVYFLGRNTHSWFFTKPKTSPFFRAEPRPFGAQRNRRLTENFAWFGSNQGLEINAQKRRRGVRCRSCGEPQTGVFWVL